MEIYKLGFTIFLVLVMSIKNINSTKDVKQTSPGSVEESNPLANLILNQNEIGDVNRSGDHTHNIMSRVKRQFYYNPYYRHQRPYYYPLPVPIIVGGLGFGGGFGGRGFGGRGFGGRGFGGRGFGGGGFGGRGVGGFGGGRGGRG